MKLFQRINVITFLFLGILLQAQTPDGELKRWHKITLDFAGPNTSETAGTNPFSNYRLDVTFNHSATGTTYVVPGFYAACADAEDSSCDSGNVWRVHFSPGETGTWDWTASFVSGTDVSINGGGSNAGFMNGDTGSFSVDESDKSARDHRAKEKGRLQYVGEHYLRYSGTNSKTPNGKWFIKAGADSPENALAYADFDNTPNRGGRRKAWAPHQQDYIANDASAYTWDSGKGSELLGVVNYLSSEGANAMSFLTFSLGGDDENVFPHLMKVSENVYNGYGDADQWNKGVHKDRFDVSKMAQWEKVFEYADKKGMYLHFKTLETENDQFMDGGNNLGRERKLYYRELIARFGHHLALNWNLSEESSLNSGVIIENIEYINDIDPYHHNVVLHTFPAQKETRYNPLLGNKSKLTGASLQSGINSIHGDVVEWIQKSRNANRKWVVANDEQGSANTGIRVSDEQVRDLVLYGTLMAGGAGVEYYYGYTNTDGDLNGQDHRLRGKKYKEAGYAIDFFENYFQEYLINAVSDDGLTGDSDDYVLANSGKGYAIYLPEGGSTSLSLPSGNSAYTVQWFNPRSGGSLTTANTLGNSLTAPDSNDWIAFIKKSEDTTGGGTCIPLEVNGVVAVEAENFVNQTKSDIRQWYVQDGSTTTPTPDIDPSHHETAAGGGYLEILPDTRVTEEDVLIGGENFSNVSGQIAVIDYEVMFTNPGRYYVFVRAYSTGTEDNGIHVGVDGNWPATGNKMQWCSGKNQWTWESRKRDTGGSSCGIDETIYIDIPSAGMHTISFSMREDGFEIDKFVLSQEFNKPTGVGPDVVLDDCSGTNIAPNVSLTSPDNGSNFEIGASIELSADASDSDGTIETVEFFLNGTLEVLDGLVPYQTIITIDNAGTYEITAIATDNEGSKTTSASRTITVGDTTTGTAIAIPGSFETEDYENLSGSVRTEVTPGAAGNNLGYIQNGDYAEYNVNIEDTGEYTVDIYASSAGKGGTIEISEARTMVGSLTIPVTGEWHSYKAYSTTISLSSGEKTLRLSFKGATGYLFNVDKVVVTKEAVAVEQTVTLSPIQDAYLQGSTGYNSEIVRIEQNNRSGYLMFDLSSIAGTITSADLKFTVYSDAGSGDINVNQGSSNSWTETTLSSANKPNTSDLLGSINTTFSIDKAVTIPLKTGTISGDQLTLILSASSGNDFAFASKENTETTKPQLVITYTSDGKSANISEEIKVFPIPVSDFVNFSGVGDGAKIKVFSLLGSLQKEITLKEGERSINLGDLSTGYYMITILEMNKVVITKKILKL